MTTGIRQQVEQLRESVTSAYPHGFMVRDYDQGVIDACDNILGQVSELGAKVALRLDNASTEFYRAPILTQQEWSGRCYAYQDVLDLIDGSAEKKREAGQQ